MVKLLYLLWAHDPVGVLVFDLVWLILALRRGIPRIVRAAAAIFLVGEMILFLVTRTPSFAAWHVPRWAADAERIWNWTGPLLAGALALLAAARWLRRRGVARPSAGEPSRRDFLRTGIAAAPVILVGGLDVIALRQGLRTRERTLALPGLPRHLEGLKIAHLSDLHVGPYTSERVLEEMVRRVNTLRPDLVLMTGDWVNRDLSDLPTALALLRRIDSRFGHFGIEGNHDLLEDGAEFRRRVEAAGIPLLRDSSLVTEVRGGPLQLLGIRWGSRTLSETGETPTYTGDTVALVAAQRAKGVFPILLAHHPHAFDAAAAARFPLTLAGHTHGGQIIITDHIGIGPAVFRYWSGWYQKGPSQLFVSNGVGNFFPLRVQAPAEIVSLTLRAS